MEREELRQETVEESERSQSNTPANDSQWDTYSVFQVVAYTVISLAMLGFFIYLCVQ